MSTMNKEQWINEVYELLCKYQGAPENDIQRKNLREWAEALATADVVCGVETSYFEEGFTPHDAVMEEMSCGG